MTIVEWELLAICFLLGIGVWLLLGTIERLDQVVGVLKGIAEVHGEQRAFELKAEIDSLHETVSRIEDGIDRIDYRIQTEIEFRK